MIMKGVYLVLVVFVGSIFLFSSLVSAGELHKNLKKELEKIKLTDDVPVIIKYKNRPVTKDLDSLKAIGKVKKQHKIVNAISGSLRADLLESFVKDPNIEKIEPDYKTKAFLDTSTKQILADKVWPNSTGKGVNVAILDTGIASHPALTNVVKRVDFTGEGTGDLNGHGTHVAGIIGSQDTKFKGVATGASFFEDKVLRADGSGYASDLIAGLDWAVENEADIASLSLGAKMDSCDGTDILSETVDNTVKGGVLVVVAAGNSGPNSSTINSPGCSKLGLSVGAVDDSDKIPDFSSRGPTADGRIKPDIMAPGVGITSVSKSGGFVTLSGTSMATPHVAGLAALLLEVNSSLKPEDLKNIIKSNAVDLGLDPNTQGSGRIDAYKSYLSILPKSEPSPTQSIEPSPITVPENQTELPEEPDRTNQTDPGILPDKFNYGFKRFSEFLDVFFDGDNLSKAQKHIIYAELRIAEAHAIVRGRASLSANFNYTSAIEKLIDEYQEGVKKSVSIAKIAREKNDTRIDEFLAKRIYRQKDSLDDLQKAEPKIKENIERVKDEIGKKEKESFDSLLPEKAATIAVNIVIEKKGKGQNEKSVEYETITKTIVENSKKQGKSGEIEKIEKRAEPVPKQNENQNTDKSTINQIGSGSGSGISGVNSGKSSGGTSSGSSSSSGGSSSSSGGSHGNNDKGRGD